MISIWTIIKIALIILALCWFVRTVGRICEKIEEVEEEAGNARKRCSELESRADKLEHKVHILEKRMDEVDPPKLNQTWRNP